MLVAAAACHGAAMEVRVWWGRCCCGCGGVDDDSAASESSRFSALSDRSECRDFLGHCGTTIFGACSGVSLCLYTALRKRGPIANE